MNLIENLWYQRYRPSTVAETVLPPALKAEFQKYVDDGFVPNLILAGPSGCGKTTVAVAMLKQLNCDYIIINGSMKGNIDTLRNEIQSFASTISILASGRKYVILDEADFLNASSTQPALRNFMEQYSKNCGFILTCNFKNRLLDALHSRCDVIDFVMKPAAPLAMSFMKRCCEILDKEKVVYERPVVAEIVQRHFPDFRRTINVLQRLAIRGPIDTGSLTSPDYSISVLVDLMRDQNYTEIRKWVASNTDNDVNGIMRRLYDVSSDLFTPDTIPLLVMAIGTWQYRGSLSVDHEIVLMCCITEIMINCRFKA